MKNSKSLSVVDSNNKVLVALQTIEERLQKLEGNKNYQQKTNGRFKYAPYSNVEIEISKVENITELINVDSYLKAKDDAYNESATKTFGLKQYPVFKWQGFTYEEWKSDLQARASIINYNSMKTELEAQKREIESFLSKEDRKVMALMRLGFLTAGEVVADSEENDEE